MTHGQASETTRAMVCERNAGGRTTGKWCCKIIRQVVPLNCALGSARRSRGDQPPKSDACWCLLIIGCGIAWRSSTYHRPSLSSMSTLTLRSKLTSSARY
ncbi:hypothetical protein BV22DRAFT_752182 [Leucogyrophana mollusca]|uniref:Uncharacterized protein n=1 Tax=Leucogyrophana mollusca TaxID=85980 RepID=A0ACB8B889_9AGAM|nr:hypothetical protein BV22DRAFT_752182 [Leucogyrophana mollusca]